MHKLTRRVFAHPVLALGSTVLWGIVEFVALCRSRWQHRRAHSA
jgi:hypothetical protein